MHTSANTAHEIGRKPLNMCIDGKREHHQWLVKEQNGSQILFIKHSDNWKSEYKCKGTSSNGNLKITGVLSN